MENLFINNLNKKDINHFTSDTGLFLRRKLSKPFRKGCNIFTKANIIDSRQINDSFLSDEEYFNSLNSDRLPLNENINSKKNNIVLERYPNLNKDEPYIFVCNHTCPEDIETALNVIDRNAYLVLGSIESLKYNREMYLSWLNGMIPFDILNEKERKELIPKMCRVLKTNSVLIFLEGSHNYDATKVINYLFDGATNAALASGRKIVITTLVKDHDNNVAYMDFSNPIDISKLEINISDYYPRFEEKLASNENTSQELMQKYYIKSITCYLRDMMSTATYYILLRHIDYLRRKDYSSYQEIMSEFHIKYMLEAFSQLRWRHDVFKAEYLTKKPEEEREYEEVVNSLSAIRLNSKILKSVKLNLRDYVLRARDLENNDVVNYMRNYWLQNKDSKGNVDIKKLTKEK